MRVGDANVGYDTTQMCRESVPAVERQLPDDRTVKDGLIVGNVVKDHKDGLDFSSLGEFFLRLDQTLERALIKFMVDVGWRTPIS